MCKECISISDANSGNISEDIKMNQYWDEFVSDVRHHFNPDGDILFYADFSSKYDKTPFEYFLDYMPDRFKQYYNCYACKSFINKYGRLCYIDSDTGELISAVWHIAHGDELANPFLKFGDFMTTSITDCRVSGVYLNTRNDIILGSPTVKDDYNHIWINAPKYIKRLRDSSYCYELHKTFMTHVHSIPKNIIDTTFSMLENDVLNRKEKFIDSIRYVKRFLELENSIADRDRKYNIGWVWSIYAHDGVWNIKNSAIGRFMESLEKNGSEVAVKEFNSVIVNPMKYQRPTKEVSTGGAMRANQLFKELNINPSSLQRRFATWNEIKEHAIWTKPINDTNEENANDPFSYMINKSNDDDEKYVVRQLNISKDDFINKILNDPEICGIGVVFNNENVFNHHIVCIVGPNQQDNSPILYYDHEDNRNPYSWFTFNGSNLYGIYSYDNLNVVGIIRTPNQWYDEDKTGINHTILIFDKGDCNVTNVSSCLFPELLRKELHEIRAVIEKYSKDHNLYRPTNKDSLAIGLCIDSLNGTKDIGIRVEYPNYYIMYNIF